MQQLEHMVEFLHRPQHLNIMIKKQIYFDHNTFTVGSNCMPACGYDTSNTIRIVFLRSQSFEVNLSLGACGKIVIQLFSNYDRQIVLKFSASAVPVHVLSKKVTL